MNDCLIASFKFFWAVDKVEDTSRYKFRLNNSPRFQKCTASSDWLLLLTRLVPSFKRLQPWSDIIVYATESSRFHLINIANFLSLFQPSALVSPRLNSTFHFSVADDQETV